MFKELNETMPKELKESIRMISYQREYQLPQKLFKRNHIEILDFKRTITEMKNLVSGLNNRYELADEIISHLEGNNSIEIIQCEE